MSLLKLITHLRQTYSMNYCGYTHNNMYQYIPKHFKVQEFVDPDTYKVRGDAAISVMDWRILWTADAIREYFTVPLIINNWCYGGDRQWSGIRYSNSPNYSQFSQHTYGRAIDFIIKGVDASNIRKEIINKPNEKAFQYITTLEDFSGMGWIHLDCRVLRKEQKRYLIVKG